MGAKNKQCDSMDQRKQFTTDGSANSRGIAMGSAGFLAHMSHGVTQWAQTVAMYIMDGPAVQEPRPKGSACFVVSRPSLLPWERERAITKWSRHGPHAVSSEGS